MTISRNRRLAVTSALAALAASGPGALAQEIVQPLPPAGSVELSSALQRLAQNGGDVEALLDAGDAALKLRDIPAAIGFFGRAKDISPANPRVSLGLARAYTYSRRPVEALRLYADAERGGIQQAVMAADRGLAFDLVGDAASAQQLYRLAIANGADDEVTRHLALSQAISGDKAGFEATLLPMLKNGDSAGFRTRAFGLAILGQTEEAVKIAEQMMPAQTAARVAPYLRYMTQLTPAQQAAAGSLGVFPRTASIGRDDADIAAYAGVGKPQPARTARAELPPVNAPLAPPVAVRPDRPAASAPASGRASLPAPVRSSEPGPKTAPPVAPAVTTVTPSSLPDPRPAAEPVRREVRVVAAPSGTATSAADLVARSAARTTQPIARNAAPVPVATQPVPAQSAGTDQAPAVQATSSTVAALPPVEVTFSQPQQQSQPQQPVQMQQQVESRPLAPSVPPEPAQSVAEAFAGFDLASSNSTARAGAVDITSIKVPREVEKPMPPPPPAHPARHWVQVATGKDLSALGFDWRRIARKADGALDGKGPFTTRWGEANRLLAGPYESRDAARDMVNKLKQGGLDAFPFSSEVGEEIIKLK